MDLTTLPEGIELRTADRTFRISWADEHESAFGFRDLRLMCRCASCVDEMTGRPLLDPASVPDDIEPVADKIDEVGNYGIQILWSCGHGTGIFTWDKLRAACPCCQA